MVAGGIRHDRLQRDRKGYEKAGRRGGEGKVRMRGMRREGVI